MTLLNHQQSLDKQSPKRIIAVDDNEILLRVWKRILEKKFYSCFTTSNPEEALSYLEGGTVDLLICDIVMPHMDGFELLQKAQQLSKGTRILLTTGYLCDFKKLRFDVGAKDIHVLMKPYNNFYEIENLVARLLGDDQECGRATSLTSLDDTKVHLWSL